MSLRIEREIKDFLCVNSLKPLRIILGRLVPINQKKRYIFDKREGVARPEGEVRSSSPRGGGKPPRTLGRRGRRICSRQQSPRWGSEIIKRCERIQKKEFTST